MRGQRGHVMTSIVLGLSGAGAAVGVLTQMPPEPAYDILRNLLGATGAQLAILTIWYQVYGKKLFKSNGWDEAKVFAEIARLEAEHTAKLKEHRADISKDVANAITLALKDIELLLEKHASRERERRGG